MAEALLNGRYELLEKLGEGGVAVVYKAQDLLLTRVVAVKILREQFTGDPVFVERFQREAQAAARLSHPNIISIYDVGQDGNQHYIVMEYIEGQDLKALITSSAPLPVGQALSIAGQVCAALSHAHQQGFVHRDIKPQNILLNSRAAAANTAPGVKVADFGLVRSLSTATVSGAGLVLGTIHYISPEQARGDPATAVSDIYSLGVVLYEMLTGRLPFDSDTAVGLALKHIQDPAAPPSRLNPLVPPTVDSIVLRALAKQPDQRYASAADMGEALASYRQFSEQATGRFQPVRVGTAGASAAAVRTAPAAAPPFVARPPVGVRPAAPVAAKKRGGIDWMLIILLLVTFAAIGGLVPLAYAVRDTVFPGSPPAAPQVAVPNIINLDQAEAQSQLQAIGLAMAVQDTRYDDKVPAQHIIAQLVPPGTMAPQGQTVEVIVSRGKQSVKIPPVTGLAFNDATNRLSNLGLQVQRVDAPSADVPAGAVISQDPVPDSETQPGAVVKLTVSAGNRVTVPDLFGKSEADAQRMIRDAGLATSYVNTQAREDVPAANRWVFDVVPVGGVISQSPQAGSLVDRGAPVRIAIRKQ